MNNRTWLIMGITLIIVALGIAIYVSQRGPEASVINSGVAPIANNDGPVYTMTNNSVQVNVLENDIDTTGTTMTIVSSPQNGTVEINANNIHIYTPNSDFIGQDAYRYQICREGQCSSALVNVVVEASNRLNLTANGTGALSGVVFYDFNENGQLDNNELGMANWTVYLDLNNNALMDDNEPTTETNNSGSYEFTNLPAGDYVVRKVAQSGWMRTSPIAGFFQRTVQDGDSLGSLNFGSVSGN